MLINTEKTSNLLKMISSRAKSLPERHRSEGQNKLHIKEIYKREKIVSEYQ